MISLSGVSKRYPNKFIGLDSVSLRVMPGDFIFLVGPSGSGKTTLFNIIHGHEQATSGKLEVLGTDLRHLSKHKIPFLRRQMGMIFQDYKLLPRRTVYENIAFVLQVLHYKRTRIHQLVYQVLDLVNLSHKAQAYPTTLSGGEQQRVCIARAIVHEPALLLADEPTGNLDPDTAWDIMQLLSKINQRQTTIMVATHDWRIVNRMQKRVIRLMNGKLVRDDRVGQYA